ncbi:MAG: response regulator transcription factor [Bacteroidetes bacterium]|nr:response regulator transcription factor [Bacteroidota bacterium]
MNQKPELLLVDDAPMMTRFLSLFFAEQYTVTSCLNPEEAIDLIRKGYLPDIIVSDLDMPQMSGLVLTKVLRQLMPDCPLVVVSGLKESKHRLAALEAGADDFLAKPFHPAELQARLENLLQRSEAKKAESRQSANSAGPGNKVKSPPFSLS